MWGYQFRVESASDGTDRDKGTRSGRAEGGRKTVKKRPQPLYREYQKSNQEKSRGGEGRTIAR